MQIGRCVIRNLSGFSVDAVSKMVLKLCADFGMLLFKRFPLVAKGSIGLSWFVLWAFMVHSSPSVHPRISSGERHYIESAIGTINNNPVPTPWFRIVTSPHVWAIAVAHFCYNWAEYTLLTCMPTYLADIGILPGKNVSCFGTGNFLTYIRTYRLLC